MSGRINPVGNLEVMRGEEWKEQWCPYSQKAYHCGDWCPMFSVATHKNADGSVEAYFIIIGCNDRMIELETTPPCNQ